MECFISGESGHFGLTAPNVQELEAMAKEFEDEEQVWLLFEEFEKEIDDIANEEWVVIRSVQLIRIEMLWEICVATSNSNASFYFTNLCKSCLGVGFIDLRISSVIGVVG